MRRYVLASLAVLLAVSGPATAAPRDETEHAVEPGETLYGIANRAGVPSKRIIEANGLEPPYVIRIGQKLAIPHDGRPASRRIAARSPATAAASSLETHTVEPGDTLLAIALAEKVPQVLLAEANSLAPPYVIKVGQKLIVPRTQRHTIAKGDTGFSLSYRYAVPWKDIAVANGIEPSAPLRIGQDLLIPTVLDRPSSSTFTPKSFIWPLDGNIRRPWRPRGESNFHDGLDIEAPKGSAVRATAPGSVIFAGEEKSQFGNLVVIDHGNGWHSAYGSLERVTVKKGEQVKQGERVGLVGDTSVTRRTELHFELRKDGKPVDPVAELPETE
jgi:murein DD-endopeptidase MepM/ murein hydrolase activator NlpD